MSTRHLRKLRLPSMEAELDEVSRAASRARAERVLEALALAGAAQAFYKASAVRGNRLHVSDASRVRALASRIAAPGAVSQPPAMGKLRLSREGCNFLAAEIGRLGDYCSFTQFCILLQRARERDADADAARPHDPLP
jgi:hypothetical protein